MGAIDEQEYTMLEAIIKRIKAIPADELYNSITVSTKNPSVYNAYYDMIIGYLLRHPCHLNSIQTITRTSSYLTPAHTVLSAQQRAAVANQRRKEEWIARSLLYCTIDNYDHVGTFIDYQTPIKNKQTDKAGKIDLLSYNKAHNAFYVIEFKRKDSKEPLLRAILEAYTYYKQIDPKKLKVDFHDLVHRELSSRDRPPNDVDAANADIRAAVLMYEHSSQGKEAKTNDALMCLSNSLGVGVYLLEDDPSHQTGLHIISV